MFSRTLWSRVQQPRMWGPLPYDETFFFFSNRKDISSFVDTHEHEYPRPSYADLVANLLTY